MATISYGNAGSGLFAGGIGWLGYGVLTLAPGGSLLGNTVTLKDGSILRFDLRNTAVLGGGATVVATPQSPGRPFGIGYSGVTGNVVLYANSNSASTRLSISNITVTDPLGYPVTNYTFYIADGEVTGINESIISTTNGGNWYLVTYLGSGISPTVTGLGTQTVRYIGSGSTYRSPICATLNPTIVNSTLTESGIAGRSGVAFGISITKITLTKSITNRFEAEDQFKINISGAYSSTTTTYGNTYGAQTVSAYVYPTVPGAYILSEDMEFGSVSTLSQYNKSISYTNLTAGGTTVPTSIILPSTFTINYTDVILATITNTLIPPTISTPKYVDKSYETVTGILTYTIPITNNGTVTINNVVFKDTIPTGSNFISNSLYVDGSLVSGSPAPPGVTIPNINVGTTSTVTFKVQVTPTLPSPSVVINNSTTNFSFYALPTTLSGSNNSNEVVTTINYVKLTATKSTNPIYVDCGTTITYTILINNNGSTTVNNVILRDTIPNQCQFISNSIIVNGVTRVGENPTAGVNIGDIGRGVTATIIFQVKVVCF